MTRTQGFNYCQTHDEEFAAWKKKVDSIIQKRTGLTSDDLPDICYYDNFDEGISPSATAAQAIRAAKE